MKAEVISGNCLDVLRTLADCSVDSVVCDPPYGLSDHKPGEVTACLMAWIEGRPYEPKGKGFMGKKWDAWVPGPEVWRECMRVLKPGGHLLAFAGTRSMDLMSMAVRLSGFELRDAIGYAHDGTAAPLLAWTYGSGFPKSMDVSKAIDKEAGAQREVIREIHAPRSGSEDETQSGGRNYRHGTDRSVTAPATASAHQWHGWGTALKPAWEPIILARKPLAKGHTVAANVLAHGTGALNIDGCRVGVEGGTKAVDFGDVSGNVYGGGSGKPRNAIAPINAGRWPANLIHDGSEAATAAFPQAPGAQAPVRGTEPSSKTDNTFGTYGGRATSDQRDGGGSAARYFYCAKASSKDRHDGLTNPGPQFQHGATLRTVENADTKGNNHPTVKPTELMRYLCRLVTPPGGVVLDPFTGSGSTGRGAVLEGFQFIGIELDPDYADIARARIADAEVQRAASVAPDAETQDDRQMALI